MNSVEWPLCRFGKCPRFWPLVRRCLAQKISIPCSSWTKRLIVRRSRRLITRYGEMVSCRIYSMFIRIYCTGCIISRRNWHETVYAYPDPRFPLIRIGSLFLFDANPDQACYFNSGADQKPDPDPQHCLIFRIFIALPKFCAAHLDVKITCS